MAGGGIDLEEVGQRVGAGAQPGDLTERGEVLEKDGGICAAASAHHAASAEPSEEPGAAGVLFALGR